MDSASPLVLHFEVRRQYALSLVECLVRKVIAFHVLGAINRWEISTASKPVVV